MVLSQTVLEDCLFCAASACVCLLLQKSTHLPRRNIVALSGGKRDLLLRNHHHLGAGWVDMRCNRSWPTTWYPWSTGRYSWSVWIVTLKNQQQNTGRETEMRTAAQLFRLVLFSLSDVDYHMCYTLSKLRVGNQN